MWPDLTYNLLITPLLLILEVYNPKPTHTKSWVRNLPMLELIGKSLATPSRSNDGSLALVSCFSGGYKFALVLRCVGLVLYILPLL